MSVDETLNLIWPTAWVVAIRIPLHATTTPPTNIDEECLTTGEAVRQMQIYVIDTVIEEDRRFAEEMTDSGLVTADADSRRRKAGVATYVNIPVRSSSIARTKLDHRSCAPLVPTPAICQAHDDNACARRSTVSCEHQQGVPNLCLHRKQRDEGDSQPLHAGQRARQQQRCRM